MQSLFYFLDVFSSREEPTLIASLSGKNIVAISCGSSHSAAISAEGELFTWGRGNYGRLGHGEFIQRAIGFSHAMRPGL